MEIQHDASKILEEFCDWLKLEQNCAPTTVSTYCIMIRKHLLKEEITLKQDINRGALMKRMQDYKARTKNLAANSVRAFLRFASEKYGKAIHANIRGVRIDRMDGIKFLTIDELSALRQAIFRCHAAKLTRNLLVFFLCADAGLRLSEVLSLKIDSAFDATGAIRNAIMVKGKGNKTRVVYVSPALKSVLIKHRQMLGDDCKWDEQLVKGPKAGKKTNKGMVSAMLKQAARWAGIPPTKVSPHILRHSYAVHSLNQGRSISTVQKMLGHGDLKTTAIYLNITTELALKDAENNEFTVGF